MTTKAEIIQLLNTNDKAVARAVFVLNERQTFSEQASEHTINRNGEGFTPADARMGSSMAKFFARNGYLSPKQVAYWRKPNAKGTPRICKYAGQLLEIAQAKSAAMQKAMAERVAEKQQFAEAEAASEREAFLAKMREMA